MHELAHAIDSYLRGSKPKGGAHGPQFMRTYLYLLKQHCGESYVVLRDSAEQAGIEVAS